MDITYEIAALVALIGLSGYFSGLEVALVSVRPSKIEQLIKNKVLIFIMYRLLSISNYFTSIGNYFWKKHTDILHNMQRRQGIRD